MVTEEGKLVLVYVLATYDVTGLDPVAPTREKGQLTSVSSSYR